MIFVNRMMRAALTLRSNIRHYLPERKIYLHSGGKFRRVVIGTRLQLMAISAAVLVMGWTIVATFAVVADAAQAEQAMARKANAVATMQRQVAALEDDVALTAARLEQRQIFLAKLLTNQGSLEQLVAMMPKTGSILPGDAPASMMAPFEKLEQAQLAFVDQATAAAIARYRDNQTLIRRLGLNPARLVGQTAIAMGGPVEALDDKGGPLEEAEPRFKDLFLSWKKLDQLEKAMLSVPSLKPVKSYTYTSGFGVRYDPFTGSTAMHAGVDMAGPVGEPVHASADGVVAEAGRNGAYGKMIDIDHGRGISTRYAHLSAIKVKPGDRVKRGEMIGRMGSTGRSTGSHLHYEVRIDGRAVNPMPFLEAGEHLLAVQERAAGETGQGGPIQPTG